MNVFSFNRPRLATAYCDSLSGKGITNATSGLFLAGPRRVGKTTFLINELTPEAEKRGWITLYVDLWADKNADPALLIAESIKMKLLKYEKKITKLTKQVGLNKINLMGLDLELSQSRLPENSTLTDACRTLAALSKKPILLIIDEAQHALMTPSGLNTMFAIKSTRDQLPSLMLVLTGSNRDKLAQLVFKKDQPFFGSDITPFPLLDKAFTDAFTAWVNQGLTTNNHFSKESMWLAFKRIGHRPEILRHIAGRIAINHEAQHFSELLEQDAHSWHGRIWEEFETGFNTLTPLQQALLEELITQGQSWSPFSEASINRYQTLTGETEISTTMVQSALQQLRDREFIWQSGRGAYALEDDSFIEWFRYRKQK